MMFSTSFVVTKDRITPTRSEICLSNHFFVLEEAEYQENNHLCRFKLNLERKSRRWQRYMRLEKDE